MSTVAIPAEAFEHGDNRRYRRGCKCTPCVRSETQRTTGKNYRCATGRSLLRDSRRAAQHIGMLRDAGMSDREILKAADVCNDVFYRALRGGRIHARNEHKLLSVPVPQVKRNDSEACTSGAGTWRRLQALAIAGWPASEIATDLSTSREHVCFLRNARGGGEVTLRTANRVKEVFAQLWDKRPEENGVPPYIADRVRRVAHQNGWHPAAVWDRIDDPDDEPNYGEQVSRVEAIVEDTAELIRQGLSPEGISMRLGIAWDSVRRAHLRAGVPVPEVAA